MPFTFKTKEVGDRSSIIPSKNVIILLHSPLKLRGIKGVVLIPPCILSRLLRALDGNSDIHAFWEDVDHVVRDRISNTQ